MFNKKLFSEILFKIYKSYNNQREFAEATGVNRAYLSQYINQKLDNPPSPKILERISVSSNGKTTYNELMKICGYIKINKLSKDTYSSFVKITDEEWEIFFGKNRKINLSENESVAWANLIDKLDYPDSKINTEWHFNYILEDYTKYAKNEKESAVITRLFFYFQFLIAKRFNKVDDYNNIINTMKKEKRFSSTLERTSQYYMVPIVGKIAAGKPILADEYIEGYLPVDPNIYGLSTSDDLFYLRVSGQSMNLKVKNGDYALIHKQDYAEDGDIIAAIVNGDDEATLKRYKKLNEQFVLLEPMSTDLSIEAITVDLKNTNFKILGKAIGQFGKF